VEQRLKPGRVWELCGQTGVGKTQVTFSQHFHQQLTNHMETAKRSEPTMLSVSTHAVNSSECHKASDPQANASVKTTSAGASETGVISVS